MNTQHKLVPATYEMYGHTVYSDWHLFTSIDWQKLRDLTPCRICGGDRLRADFTDSTRCHAPLPEAPTNRPTAY